MKLLQIIFLLAGLATAHAQTLDKRYVFDPQNKDPTQISLILSRLDREEDSAEKRHKESADQLSTLERTIARVRSLQLTDQSPYPVPPEIVELAKSRDKISNFATMQPYANELERMLAAVRAFRGNSRPPDDAIFEISRDQQLRSRISRPRLQTSCDIDDFDEYLTQLKKSSLTSSTTETSGSPARATIPPAQAPAGQSPSPANAGASVTQTPVRQITPAAANAVLTRELIACISYAQNPPNSKRFVFLILRTWKQLRPTFVKTETKLIAT